MGSEGYDAKHSAQYIVYMGRIYLLAQFIECSQCISYLLPCNKWPHDFAAYSNIYSFLGQEAHVSFTGMRSSCCHVGLSWATQCPHDMEAGFPRVSDPQEGETNACCLL